MISIALTGDVMLGRGVNEALAGMRPEEPWGDVLPLLRAANLCFINLECAVTRSTTPWTRTPKVFHFRADPAAVEVLRRARIDACSLANNHAMDFEEEGLIETMALLDLADIKHAGAGRNRDEAIAPALLQTPEGRVALVAATDNAPEWAAGADLSGVNFLPVSLEPDVLDRIESMILAARRRGAGIVVFSNHWGPNMVEGPTPLFRRFAHAVIDRGADIYYGHSAHLFQEVEIYRGKPIVYDAGDFLDDYMVDPSLHNDWSFLVRVWVEKDRFRRLELLPVVLTYAHVRRATPDETEALFRRMERLCTTTPPVRREDRLVFEG